MLKLASNPLIELQTRSFIRGVCNKEGFRLSGAPWAFQYAENTNQKFPVIKTLGFQRISEEGVTFIVRNKTNQSQKIVSICYVEGIYPPLEDKFCEQWRMEGLAEKMPTKTALETAPPGSLAQIIAVSRWGQSHETRDMTKLNEDQKEKFVILVRKILTELKEKRIKDEEVDTCVAMFKLFPSRVEL